MERDSKDKACCDQKLVLAGCFIHSNDKLAITTNQENPLLHSLSISCGNTLKCKADGKQPVIYDCY